MKRFLLATALGLAVTGAQAAQVTFYQLPQNAFPHDVAPGADGIVWYSGQQLGVLGRFDPATGAVEQIPLGRSSAPHGVIVAPDRAVWLNDGGQNALVRFEPSTRAMKVFPLPSNFPHANLNTAVVDKTGVVWFTGQSGVYGRVDPVSGKVDAWAAPRGFGPYGITMTPSGEIWYASRDGFGLGAWVLFGILFLWQLPHTLAIARLYREEYARAGVRLLPVVDADGTSTERQIVSGCLALLAVSLLPTLIGLAGPVYFVGAFVLGAAFVALGARQALSPSPASARRVLYASLFYLPILLALLAFDKV